MSLAIGAKRAEEVSIVFLGLSITSSWGNHHASTYRSLLKGLASRGHRCLFLERERPWLAEHRDLSEAPYAAIHTYRSVEELEDRWWSEVQAADLVVVGSGVPDGVRISRWVLGEAKGVRAFYDVDTAVTVAKLERGDHEYVSPAELSRFDLVLSATGGPLGAWLERAYRLRQVVPLYPSCDPEVYRPTTVAERWDLGFLGSHDPDRQAALDDLLLGPARRLKRSRFVVAGPGYSPDRRWPGNVERLEFVPPPQHADFYGAQRFTLSLTPRTRMDAGWSPSVRLFEAAACAAPILSDAWPGIESLFEPGQEILVVRTAADVEEALALSDKERRVLGRRARSRVLAEHTADQRAAELEAYYAAIRPARVARPRRRRRRSRVSAVAAGVGAAVAQAAAGGSPA